MGKRAVFASRLEAECRTRGLSSEQLAEAVGSTVAELHYLTTYGRFLGPNKRLNEVLRALARLFRMPEAAAVSLLDGDAPG